jgi:hypothetical protein
VEIVEEDSGVLPLCAQARLEGTKIEIASAIVVRVRIQVPEGRVRGTAILNRHSG